MLLEDDPVNPEYKDMEKELEEVIITKTSVDIFPKNIIYLCGFIFVYFIMNASVGVLGMKRACGCRR